MKLYQTVAADIVRRIVDAEFTNGARLPAERALAQHYGVSRATIREACVALEIQGWVGSRRGAGIFINKSHPPKDTIPDCDVGPFELLEARHVIEGEAAAIAALVATEDQLSELSAHIDRMRQAPDSPSGEQADGEFHVLIAQITRNSVIAETVEKLWSLRYLSPLCQEIFARGRRAGVMQPIDDHMAILDALHAQDSDAARSAMHAHINGVIECLLDATENDDRAPVIRRRDFVHTKLKRATTA